MNYNRHFASIANPSYGVFVKGGGERPLFENNLRAPPTWTLPRLFPDFTRSGSAG